MKRKTLLFSAFLIGTVTVALQLPQSVADGVQAASTPDGSPTLHVAASLRRQKGAQVQNTRRVAIGPALRHPVFAMMSASTPPLPLSALSAPDIDAEHGALAREVLGLLPVSCQQKLKSFYLLDDDDKRGFAGSGVVMVSRKIPNAEFRAVLIHEALGHFWDLTCINGTPESGPSAFTDGTTPVWNNDPSALFYAISWKNNTERRTLALANDSTTGYAGQGGPYEDLADSITYYLTEHDAFVTRAKTNRALALKLQWIETYFPVQPTVATGQTWNGVIPWDATKVPYTWNGGSL